MAELELHGYLTTGKFNVNDYVIEIERVDGGMKMTVTDGDGTVQSVTVKDGTAGMTDQEIEDARALLKTMTDALGTWTENEEARAAAEKLRDIAENGAEGETDQTKYRQGLYALMLALYNKLKDYPDTVEGYVSQVKASAKAAANSATAAAESAKSAAEISLDTFSNYMFYKDGDYIAFWETAKGEGEAEDDRVSSSGLSYNACIIGYVTDSAKCIHLKIPVAKSLANINRVVCNYFQAYIANEDGYAIRSGFLSGGDDYLPYITGIGIDKVQNCIHVAINRGKAWNLQNNQCVFCRPGKNDGGHGIKFTLYTSASDTTDSTT